MDSIRTEFLREQQAIQDRDSWVDDAARKTLLDADSLMDLDDYSQWFLQSYEHIARMFRNFDSACIELSKLPADQTRALTGMFQAVLGLRDTVLKDARQHADEYDPSPYCSACHAKTREQCDCGPLDPMD